MTLRPHWNLARLLTGCALATGTGAAHAAEPTVMFPDAEREQVLEALYEECYAAGMLTEAVGDDALICSRDLQGDETLDGVALAGVYAGRSRHRVRFTSASREGGIRVWAYPWIEIEEPDGTLLEQPIESDAYLSRLEDVLRESARTLREPDRAARPWAEYYASEQEWRLAAHLRAVAFCDEQVASLTADELDRQLAAAAIHPLGKDLRSRCEELYEEVFRWSLARGNDSPTLEAYVDYRASLAPEERRRACTGRIALTSSCG